MSNRRLWTAFWLFHLTFCLLFVCWPAFHTDANPLWRWLHVYGAYTGASNAYGFFAPAVPSARRVSVTALCGDQSFPVEIPLQGESRHRLTTIMSLTAYKQIEEAVAGSLAAYAMGRYPCSSVALVRLEYFAVPSMADYRRGERPEWKLLHVYPLAKATALRTTAPAER